ncbi:MAG: metallophosphoesterase [Clostridia bacterium]|nr:metallophosphoesterase [Clostridia bacterium]
MGKPCNKHKKTALTILLAFVAFILILCVAGIAVSYFSLKTTHYNICLSGINTPVSCVVLSDLHDSSFGKDNEKLIRKVKDCNPDVIFTVGDMVSEYCEDYSYLSSLYDSLSEIAPTYCSLGNHERSHPEFSEIRQILSEHATLLDNRYIDLNLKGNEIRLGGLMGYHPDSEHLNDYIRDFADTDRFTLLLSHCPEYYTWGVDEVKIDLMVSGHTHGGQVVLPFKGGLFAPEQGYFPHYDYGVFYEENATMVISRGLGSSRQAVPRFNNPPEIVSLTLTPEV